MAIQNSKKGRIISVILIIVAVVCFALYFNFDKIFKSKSKNPPTTLADNVSVSVENGVKNITYSINDAKELKSASLLMQKNKVGLEIKDGSETIVVTENDNVTFELKSDIDMKDESWTAFNIQKGYVFDGKNFAINNLNINEAEDYLRTSYSGNDNFATESFVGLVSYNAGVIKNLKVNNLNLYLEAPGASKSLAYFIGLVGSNEGTIANVVIGSSSEEEESLIFGTDGSSYYTPYETITRYVGSIAARNMGTINSCYSYAVVNNGNITGGIAGVNSSSAKIENCTNNGNLTGRFDGSCYEFGGIAGKNYGTIELCSNSENASVNCGLEDDKEYCYVGGVVGHNVGGTISKSGNNAVIKGGSAKATVAYAGGVVGYNEGICDVNNCYNNGFVSVNAKQQRTTIYTKTISDTNQGVFEIVDGTFDTQIWYNSGYTGKFGLGVNFGGSENKYTLDYNNFPYGQVIAVRGEGLKTTTFQNEPYYESVKLTYFTNLSVEKYSAIYDAYAGGICGYNSNANSTFEDCYNAGHINSENNNQNIYYIRYDIYSKTYTLTDNIQAEEGKGVTTSSPSPRVYAVTAENQVNWNEICGNNLGILTDCYYGGYYRNDFKTQGLWVVSGDEYTDYNMVVEVTESSSSYHHISFAITGEQYNHFFMDGNKEFYQYLLNSYKFHFATFGGVDVVCSSETGSFTTDLSDFETDGEKYIGYNETSRNGTITNLYQVPSGFDSSIWGVNSEINGGLPYIKDRYWIGQV